MYNVRAGLTIRRPHTNVRQGPFTHTRSQDFLWGALFFPKKLTTFFPFLVVLVTLNVQTSKQRGKNLKNGSWSGSPGGGGGGSHGTTGTMVNPALGIGLLLHSLLAIAEKQFGFKKGISLSHAIYTVREFVVTDRWTVKLCAIDVGLSKALDNVNHHTLFVKLMKRHFTGP